MRSPLAAVRRFLADEPYRRLSDDELWARFRDHADGDSLRIVLERVGGRLSARCRAITNDPTLAEDALQETLLQLVRYRRRIGTYNQAVAWLYRVADSRARLLMRSRRRAWWREWRVARSETITAPEASDFEVVAAAVARLPSRERQAVELVFLESMTTAQAAEALGIRQGSVNTYVLRGVRRLQRSLNRTETATLGLLAAAGAGYGDGGLAAKATELASLALQPTPGRWLPLGLAIGTVATAGTAVVVGWPAGEAPPPPAVAATVNPAETVAERSLRLFHTDIRPRQEAAMGQQVLNGGTMRLVSVTAYDSRLECWYEFAHRYPDGRPFFTSRLLLRHQSANGSTQTIMDRFGTGELRTINPDRFLILWTDDPVSRKEIIAASSPLKAAIAAFEVLPQDDAARTASSEAATQLGSAVEPLTGDWYANGQRAARWTVRWGQLRQHFGLVVTDDKQAEHLFDQNWARVDEAGRLAGLEPVFTGFLIAAPPDRLTFVDRSLTLLRRPTD